jgi:type I restriction-modification system DNA methylase subunit
MFYNTGIYTYVWVLTNRKLPERAGHVQLIDTRDLYAKMPKSLGNKRNYLTEEHIGQVTGLYEAGTTSPRSQVVPNEEFGYRKITIERPLRVRWEVTEDGLAKAAAVKKLDDDLRTGLLEALRARVGYRADTAAAFTAGLDVPAPRTALTAAAKAFQVRDPDVPPVPKRGGGYEPDPAVPFPGEGLGGQGPQEQTDTLANIIDRVNEAKGLALNDSHRLVLDQVMETLKDDENLRPVARSNSYSDFLLEFKRGSLIHALLGVEKSNKELFDALLQDQSLLEQLGDYYAPSVFDALRAESGA